ncbi:CFI-box-CTERM domain-containing protein [Chloroflexota bacterium]
MNKRLSICLLSIVMLISGMVPQVAIAAEADDNLLTAAEESFFLRLGSQIGAARESLAGYQALLTKLGTDSGVMNWGMSGMPMPAAFEGCALPVSVPDTVADIAGMWDTEVCNEFGYISTKLDSVKTEIAGKSSTGILVEVVSTLTLVNQTVKDIDGSIAAIETMSLARMDELKETRQEAKEADREVKKSLDLDDDFCFIATAAYGTAAAEEIDVLRQFRDEFLRDSSLGTTFINFYYKTSPPLADFIAEHEVLRTMVREILVDPVVAIVDSTISWWE